MDFSTSQSCPPCLQVADSLCIGPKYSSTRKGITQKKSQAFLQLNGASDSNQAQCDAMRAREQVSCRLI